MHLHINWIPDTTQNQRLPDAGFSLQNAADWANVFVAGLALLLSFYTLIKQLDKDRKAEADQHEKDHQAIEKERKLITDQQIRDESAQLEAEKLRAQTIRLQWYKDLIVAPKVDHLSAFYVSMHTLRDQIKTPDLTSDQKIELIEHIKQQGKKLRQSLIDAIFPINEVLYDKFINELDQLTDDLTAAIDNDQLKLNNEAVYNEHIHKRLAKSEKQLFTLIYSYRGE